MMRLMKAKRKMIAFVGVAVGIVGCSGVQPDVPGGAEANTTLSSSSAVSDEAYVAFRNAHENSQKIPTMIVALIKHHIAKEEFLLAQFYCDEYLRDYPSGKDRDEVDYLHLKILFGRYDRMHDDRIAAQATAQAKQYLATHGKRSHYRGKVEALLKQWRQHEKIRNEKLAKYYKQHGKPKAAAFYLAKIKLH